MLSIECITESGSTVKLHADGWVEYLPCVESIRRGMKKVVGSTKDDICADMGDRLHLRLITFDGDKVLTTSPVATITVRVGTKQVRSRPRLALLTD